MQRDNVKDQIADYLSTFVRLNDSKEYTEHAEKILNIFEKNFMGGES